MPRSRNDTNECYKVACYKVASCYEVLYASACYKVACYNVAACYIDVHTSVLHRSMLQSRIDFVARAGVDDFVARCDFVACYDVVTVLNCSKRWCGKP